MVPLPLFDDELEIPVPEPDWKQELNQKLEDYRMRQFSRTGNGDRLAQSAQTGDLVAAKRNIIPFVRTGGGETGGRQRSELKKALSARSVNPQWRRVERPDISHQLPPLRKPANGHAAVIEQNGKTRETPAQANGPSSAHGVPSLVAPLATRAIAGLLDLVLVLIALGVFVGVFRLMGGPIMTDVEGIRSLAFAFFAITVFYWVFYVRYIGETAGMTWVGLRLVSFDGRPPTEEQRRARAFGTVLSTAAVGLGFAWSVADDEQLSWHDRISKTLVTRDEPRALERS